MSVFLKKKPTFATAMKKIRLLYLLLTVAAMFSCTAKNEVSDAPAADMLEEARTLMEKKEFSAARDTILSMRQRYPQALDVRRAAILTLDSVELLAARDSVVAYEQTLQAERERFQQMQPRVDGHTNDAYYEQQRLVMAMDQRYDELCAKVKFFLRKMDIDKQAK